MTMPEDDRDDRTVFIPSGSVSPAPAVASTAQPRQIQVGDVLNHIFEVKRFIARGGMGEVFEGINVSSEERVAIKVILPNLAADPNVQAMFRKEARTLTRLSHPALVQYRVLAQEPVLGVFYIVTEYVDGQNLSDVLASQNPTAQDLINLTRRLAEGLNAAHALGAIHRDISPDNVMLEGGKLAGAKIIDFGIAKDLDPGSATIIGDGFAGKLNYVSPEQLGDYDRSVGPWTDVYSLGLVILAVATKRDVDMGGTLVDAVDKRRAGPNLSIVPDELRPILEQMLKANPGERLRSMSAVIEMLTAPSGRDLRRRIADASPIKPDADSKPGVADWIKAHVPLVAGGATALAAVIAGLIYLTSGSGSPSITSPTGSETVAEQPAAPAPSVVDPVAAARAALNAGLPSIACTWLDVVSVTPDQSGVSVVLRGVAGNPAQAQTEISKLLSAKGVKASAIDSTDVAPVQMSECGPLEAFRQIRNGNQESISVPQRKFEMAKLTEGEFKGQVGAKAVINLNLSDTSVDYALFGLEPSGLIEQVAKTKEEITTGFTPISKDKYRLEVDVNHTGWSGLLLLSGKKPVGASFVAGPRTSRDAAWTQRFLSAARAGGWKSEMVWFKTVDEQPN
jgi:eukaryotic-like serine/threonine-protein kinase